MQKMDAEILRETRGNIHSLESAIKKQANLNTNDLTNIFGYCIPLKTFLLSKENAIQLVLSTVHQHWGTIDLLLLETFKELSMDIETANQKLKLFLTSDYGEKKLIDYLRIHNQLYFNNFIFLVFGKELSLPNSIGGLSHFYLFEVGNKYFLQIMYNHHPQFWKMLLAKKIFSIFMQVPLHDIQNSVELMKLFKKQLASLFTLNQSVKIFHNLIQLIDYENPKSYPLKEMHILNVITHFQGGRRHQKKLNKLVTNLYQTWKQGSWALSEKERTLLSYIMTIDCFQESQFQKVIEYGGYLIDHDRLLNHSIELLLEYNDVLPSMKPEPNTLLKRYDQNYLEQIFYILINALVQKKQYYEVMILLEEHELASCSSIYHYLNSQENKEDLLHQIEATIQIDIAFLVDHSPHHIKHSINKWLECYHKEDSPYYYVVKMTSSHITNILKACFATEHYELFEKLMEIYKKYLLFDEQFEDLREFMKTYI